MLVHEAITGNQCCLFLEQFVSFVRRMNPCRSSTKNVRNTFAVTMPFPASESDAILESPTSATLEDVESPISATLEDLESTGSSSWITTDGSGTEASEVSPRRPLLGRRRASEMPIRVEERRKRKDNMRY